MKQCIQLHKTGWVNHPQSFSIDSSKKNSLIAMHLRVVVYLCPLAHVPWQLHIVVEKTNNIIKIDGKMIKIHIV
jgi:hypothetical protein